jgi:transposase InsO family protein
MDFIVGLPRTAKGFDSIWVIIDRLTKITHFLPVKVKYIVATYAELYIARILSLHGVPKTIVSDRGPQFVSKFWEDLHKSLGTKLLHSSAYHPQTSGQTERVNQILEDMLRACVLEFPQKWDDYLPLAEFSYNNSYQESINMAPFKALYDTKDPSTEATLMGGKFYSDVWVNGGRELAHEIIKKNEKYTHDAREEARRTEEAAERERRIGIAF